MALDRQQDLPILRDAFYEALKRHGGGTGGSGGGGATSGSGGSGGTGGTGGIGLAMTAVGATVKKAFDETSALAGGLGKTFLDVGGKLLVGGVKVSDFTTNLTKNLENAGGGFTSALGLGAKGIGTLVEYVEGGVDAFRELSKSGAAFNNDVVEMRVSAANTRLTLGEYSEVVKNNSADFAALGGSVAKGAQTFTNLSKSFFDSGISDNLRNMGYTAKDLNEILAIQAVSSRDRDSKNKKSVADQVEAAGRLATEMDAVAKLTGKSRKEQEDTLRKQQENGQLRAAIDLAISNGGKQVGEAYKSMSTAAQVGGKDFEKLQEQIFAMGRPSEDMAEKFALAGGAAQKLMYDAAAAAKKGDEATATRLTQEAAVAYANQQNTQQNRQLAAQGHQAAVEMNSNARALSDNLAQVAKAENLNLDNAEDRAKALNLVGEAVKKEQAAREAATSTVINAEARAADITAALNNQLVKPLKDSIQPQLMKFADTLKQLNSGPGGFRQKTEDEITGGITKVKAAYESLLADANKKTGPTPKFSSTEMETQNKAQVSALGNALKEGKRTDITDKELDQMKLLNQTLQSMGGEAVTKRLDELAKAQNKTSEQLIKEAVNKKGGIETLNKQVFKEGDAAKVAQDAEAVNARMENVRKYEDMQKAQGNTPGGTPAESMSRSVTGITDMVINGVTNLFIKDMKVDSNAQGGYIPSFTLSTLAEEGPEFVLNQPQMKSLINNVGLKGADNVLGKLPPAGSGGIDFSAISKTISTTLSSVSGGSSTTRQLERDDDGKITGIKEIVDQAKDQVTKLVEDQTGLVSKSVRGMSSSFNQFVSDAEDNMDSSDTTNDSTPESFDSLVEKLKIPAEPKSTGVDIGNMNFGPNGLPIFSQIKSNASSIPNAVNPATTQEAAEEKVKAKIAAVTQQPNKENEQRSPSTQKKISTLDDVVDSLEHLNSTMHKLLSTSESLGKQQVQATKSNAKNLYER